LWRPGEYWRGAKLRITVVRILVLTLLLQVNIKGNLTPDDEFSIMLGSFPAADPVPFQFILEDGQTELYPEAAEAMLDEMLPFKGEDYYKSIVVYSCGDGNQYCDTVLETIQERYPNASIIGGICGHGIIRKPFNAAAAAAAAKQGGEKEEEPTVDTSLVLSYVGRAIEEEEEAMDGEERSDVIICCLVATLLVTVVNKQKKQCLATSEATVISFASSLRSYFRRSLS